MERTQSRGPTHRARNDTDVPGTARWASRARALPAPAVPLPVERASSRTSERGREGPRGGERLLRKARRHEAPFAAVPVRPQHVCSRLSLRAVSHRGPEFGGFFSVLRAGGSRTAQVADRDSAAPPAARAGMTPQAPGCPQEPGGVGCHSGSEPSVCPLAHLSYEATSSRGENHFLARM